MSKNYAEEGVLHDCAMQYCVAGSQHPVHNYFTGRGHWCIEASLLHDAHFHTSALYEAIRLPTISVDDVETVTGGNLLGKYRLPVDFIEGNHRLGGVIIPLARAVAVDEVLSC